MARSVAIPNLYIAPITALTRRMNVKAFTRTASDLAIGQCPGLLACAITLPYLNIAAIVSLTVRMDIQALSRTAGDFAVIQEPCLLA